VGALISIDSAAWRISADQAEGAGRAVLAFIAERPALAISIGGRRRVRNPDAVAAFAAAGLAVRRDRSGALGEIACLVDKLPTDGFEELHALFVALRTHVDPGSWICFAELGDETCLHTFRFGRRAVRWTRKRRRRPAAASPRERASEMHLAGQSAKALAILDRALSAKPDDIELLRDSIWILYRTDRPAEAADRARRLLDLDPGNPLDWNRLGLALDDLDHLDATGVDERLAAHRMAAALSPDDATYQHNLAATLLAADRPAEAIGPAAAALKLRGDLDDRVTHAAALLQSGRFAACAAACKQARRHFPDDEDLQLCEVDALRELARYPDARAAADRLVAIQRDGSNLAILAAILAASGDPDAAAANYREALALVDADLGVDPDSAFSWRRKADIHLGLAQPGKALAAARKAVALEPAHRWSQLHLARAYLATSQPAKALAPLDRAAAIPPADAYPAYHRAEALAAVDRPREAAAALAEATAASPHLAHLAAQIPTLRGLLRARPRARKASKM
jgi:predicted Zn-dependent protease